MPSSSLRSFFRFVRRAGLGLMTGAVSLAAATRLQLPNGDHITGEIIRREGGRIYFVSPVLGQISLPEASVKVVQVPDTPVESLVGLPPARPDRAETPQPPAAPSSTPAATPPARASGSPKVPAVKPASAASQPAAPAKPAWRGKIEFGYQQQSGRRDAVQLSLRADAERSRGPDQLKATGRTLYGKQNEKTNSDRQDASFRWRHEFGKRLFGQSLTSYAADQIKAIDLNLEQNVGVGYRIIEHPRHVVNIGIGATGQHREAAGVTDNLVLLGEFFQDYTYKFSGRVSFLQEANLLYSNKPAPRATDDNYRLRFNSTLQGKVTDRVSLNLRYEYEFDNALPSDDEKADQRVTSSIGYAL